MIEQLYPFTLTDEKLIERIIEDDHAAINHIVLPQGAALPEHYSNSNVYLIVIRGKLRLKLEENEAQVYAAGKIITIPYQTKMNLSNQDEAVLEFFVVKSPSPKQFSQA